MISDPRLSTLHQNIRRVQPQAQTHPHQVTLLVQPPRRVQDDPRHHDDPQELFPEERSHEQTDRPRVMQSVQRQTDRRV